MFNENKVNELFKQLNIITIDLFNDGRKLEEHSLTEIFHRINEFQEAGNLAERYEWSYIPTLKSEQKNNNQIRKVNKE